MRKRRQKRPSFFPPIGVHISIPTPAELPVFSPLGKNARRTRQGVEEFNADANAWLKNQAMIATWINWFPIVDSREMWIERRGGLVARTQEALRTLYARYGLMPATILEMLANFYGANHASEEGWNNLRKRDRRMKDAQILREAAKIVDKYQPFIYGVDVNKGGYPSGSALEEVAITLETLPISVRNRPKNLRLMIFSAELASFFQTCVSKPLYEHVGTLLVKSLGRETWNPAGDIREATVKMVKASADATAELILLAEYLTGDYRSAQNRATEYWESKPTGRTNTGKGRSKH